MKAGVYRAACVLLMVICAGSMEAQNTVTIKSKCYHLLRWDDQCLTNQLRDPAYFSLRVQDATDAQLLQFLKQNRTTLLALMLEVDYGRAIESFLAGTPALPTESDFIGAIADAGGHLTDFLSQLAGILSALRQSTAWDLTSQSLDAISSVLNGIQVYQLAASVIISESAREVLREYCEERLQQTKEQTWSDIQSNTAFDRSEERR